MSKLQCSYRFFLVFLTIWVASECYSQDRPVRILYYQAPSGAPSHAHIYNGRELLGEAELPRSNFSETFQIPRGEVNLKFVPRALKAKERLPKRAPSARIPESWQKVLLLVFPDEAYKLMPIRIQAIDASDDAFGPGSVYVINFSEIGIAGTVGDKELKLKPKSVEIIKNPISENGFYPAKLYAYIEEGKKPRRFIKQMWQHSDNTRQVLFIMPNPAPRYVTYYCAPVENF